MQQSKRREKAMISPYEKLSDHELFLKIRDDLLHSRTGIQLQEQVSEENKEKFLLDMEQYIDRVYRISEEKKERFLVYIEKYIFGFHVLTDLMMAEDISDIKVLAWDNVRVKQLGKRKSTHVTFWSPEDFRGFVEMIAVKNGVNIGNMNALQTFTDRKSNREFIYRFDIATGAVNSTEEPYLHIRKVPKKKYSMEKLTEMYMLTPKMAQYLIRSREEGYLLISGKNGSGKTYLLNALLDEIPFSQSVLVVQENEELFSDIHPDMMFQHIAVKRGEKKIHYGLKELVINGLLIDIDHIIIGEIKGGEALYFLSAALAGCQGMTTVHSLDAAGALDKMADYCKWESDYSRDEILKMLSCVKTIVYVDDFQIQEIVEHMGWDEAGKKSKLKTVYSRKEQVDLL